MDPGTKRLLLIASCLGAVLACFFAAAALVGHRSGAVPVVTADGRPIRVRPDNPGGMQIDGAENDVFSGSVNAGDAKLAPAAEVPDPNGLRAAPPAKAAAPTVAQPLSPASAGPAATPTAKPNPPATVEASAQPSDPRPPAATVPSEPARSVPASTPAPHTASVQLAALTTEQAAHEEWQRLSHRMPTLLGSRKPTFTRTDRDGHVFWRVRTTGFPDLAQARTFCEQVRAAGGGCTVADF
jgi:hypothetical protein